MLITRELHEQMPDIINSLAPSSNDSKTPLLFELPLPLQSEELVRQFSQKLDSCLEMLKSSFININEYEMLTAARSELLELTADYKVDALNTYFRMLLSNLSGVASMLNQRTSPAELKALYDLETACEACCKEFRIELIEFKVLGEVGDLIDLQNELLPELQDILETEQKRLASEYNWERGTSRCCDRVGYNPPANSSLAPIHDIEITDSISRPRF